MINVDDTCHYPIASHLDEYVINTKGKIWVGSDCSKVGNPWQYAQFNKDTLEVALWIIDHMKLKRRSDPIRVRYMLYLSSVLCALYISSKMLFQYCSYDHDNYTTSSDYIYIS